MKNGIALEVNNEQTLFLTPISAAGDCSLDRWDGYTMEHDRMIPPGDLVMLLNFYRYVKDNDIQNDFINPNGKGEER